MLFKMPVICFRCQNLFPNTRKLALHLRNFHNLGNHENLICFQEGCRQTFSVISSLLRHIKRYHKHVEIIERVAQPGERNVDGGDESDANVEDAVQNEVLEEELLPDINSEKLKDDAASFLLHMRGTASTTLTSVNEYLNATKSLMSDNVGALKQQVIELLRQSDVDVNSDNVCELLAKFDVVSSPFEGLETVDQQDKYFLKHFQLVPSIAISLGTRYDQFVDKNTGTIRQKLITETFQYVSVVQTLACYPRSSQKETLARALVAQFPSLKDLTPGSEGHELFYCNGKGFIEYRLKTMRASLHSKNQGKDPKPKKQKVKKADDEAPTVPNTEVLERIEWMKYHPPTRDNKTMINRYARETFPYRSSIIKRDNPSITNILETMPRFLDMPELINTEFEMIHPGLGSNLLVKWKTFFAGKILAVSGREHQKLGDLKILKLLLEQLPLVSTAGKKGKTLSSFLLQHRPAGTDVQQFAKTKEAIYTQPFILALGEMDSPSEYFIIADALSIPAEGSLLEAFDRLFKVHYIFCVHFARPLQTFFNFFEGIVYKLGVPIKPSVRELYSKMVRDAIEIEG